MKAHALRTILLVKSVEDHDPDGVMLTLAEREAATREALRRHPAADAAERGRRDAHAWRVVESRAEALHARLVDRHPVVARTVSLETRAVQASLVVVVLGFLGGLALSVADSRVRIEILAFPLLGLVLWNLVVYLLLALAALWRRAPTRGGASGAGRGLDWIIWPGRWGWRRAAALIRQAAFHHRPLAAALRSYSDAWWPHAQPMLLRQGKRVFHLAAAAAALGLVGGLYVRGIALEYRAGWESTFLGPAQVRGLLHGLYGPASAVTGIALPGTDAQIEALHWRGGAGGAPAAPWIHLVAATALLCVVLPRLLLAAWTTVDLARVSRKLVVPDELQAYARRLLEGSDAALPAQSVRVTPFAFEPAAAAAAGLQRLLTDAFGPGTRIERRTSVSYGEEDAFGAVPAGAPPGVDVLLLNLAATPEAENHGAVLMSARKSGGASRRLAVVDESAFLARMGQDPSLAARVQERRDTWREFVVRHGWDAVLVDLEAAARAPTIAPETLDVVRRAGRGPRP